MTTGELNGSNTDNQYLRVGSDTNASTAISATFDLPTGSDRVRFLIAGFAGPGSGLFVHRLVDDAPICSPEADFEAMGFTEGFCRFGGQRRLSSSLPSSELAAYMRISNAQAPPHGMVFVDNIGFEDTLGNALPFKFSTVKDLEATVTAGSSDDTKPGTALEEVGPFSGEPAAARVAFASGLAVCLVVPIGAALFLLVCRRRVGKDAAAQIAGKGKKENLEVYRTPASAAEVSAALRAAAQVPTLGAAAAAAAPVFDALPNLNGALRADDGISTFMEIRERAMMQQHDAVDGPGQAGSWEALLESLPPAPLGTEDLSPRNPSLLPVHPALLMPHLSWNSKVAQSPQALRDSPCSSLRIAGSSQEQPEVLQMEAALSPVGVRCRTNSFTAPAGSINTKLRKEPPPGLELWDALLDSMDLAEVVVKSMQSSPCSDIDRGLREPKLRPNWMPPSPRASNTWSAGDMPGPEIWDSLLQPLPSASLTEAVSPGPSLQQCRSESKPAPLPPVSTLREAAAESFGQEPLPPLPPPESRAVVGRQMPDLALWEELLETVPVGEPRQLCVSGQSAKAEERAESGMLESPVKAADPQRGQGPSPTIAGMTAPGMDLWDALLKPIDAHQVPWHLSAPTEDPFALPK